MSDGTEVLRAPRSLANAEMASLAARLRRDPDVAAAEPDLRVLPALAPSDPRYPEQWYLYEALGGANLPAAWDLTTGAPGVVVAVVDTGVLLDHPDLAGRTLPGYDFVYLALFSHDGDGRDADPSDPGNWSDGTSCPATTTVWHGTHVAGTIAAVAGNSAGGAGINWTSKILPVRVSGVCGAFTTDLVDAVRWAVGLPVPGVPDNPNPAKIVNLSLAEVGNCDSLVQGAMDDARLAGALVVAGAGNGATDAAGYFPARCNGVLAVAATTRTGSLASYSNFGATVDVSAPGGDGATADRLLSTWDTGTQGPATRTYEFRRGTSYATAVVSGVASLALSANPTLSVADLEGILLSTARSFPDATCSTATCGAGIVDAAVAVRQALAAPRAPLVEAGPNQTVAPSAPVVLSGSSTDDGSVVGYSWTQVKGTAVVLTGAATASASFVAPSTQGVLTFRLTAVDNDGHTGSDSVSVSVVIPNRPPAPTAAPIITTLNTLGSTTVVANDPDRDSVTFSLNNGPLHGTATVWTVRGTVDYTPNTGYVGPDSLSVVATDSHGAAGTVTVPITVNPATPGNTAPAPTAGALTTAEDTAGTTQVAANNPDVGDTHTYAVTAAPTHGAASVSATGLVIYTPALNYNGVDSLTVTVTDAAGAAGAVVIAVTVTPVNDPPVLAAIGPRSATEGQTLTVPLSATDVDGDPLHFGVANAPAGASLVNHGDGTATFTWTPAYGDEGTAVLTFTVEDSGTPPLADSEAVTVTVTAAVVTVSIPLQAGWNLVSWPLATCAYAGPAVPTVALPEGVGCAPVASLGDALASIAGQYELVASFDADGAHTYDPGLPAYLNDLTYLAGGYGYWIRMKAPGTLTLSGRRLPPATPLALVPGWNLTGYWGADVRYTGAPPAVPFPPGVTFTPVAAIPEAFSSLGSALTNVWSHDAAGDHAYPPLAPAAPVEYAGPGYGYWLKVGAPATLQF